MSLPSDFLEKYEAELGFIVLQNPDCRMGLDQIKARLSHIAGIDDLTVKPTERGNQIYTLGDVNVEIPTTDRRHVNYLAGKLSNPFEQTEKPKMSVSGLAPGTLQAKLAELRARGQERLAQGVAKIDAAHSQGLAKIDAATDDVAKKIDAEIDSALHEFAESTNGGPV